MTSSKEKSSNTAADSDYRAFLIRCWREGDNWHFALEMVGRTQRQEHGFAGYEQLAGFLKKQFINEDDDSGSEHLG